MSCEMFMEVLESVNCLFDPKTKNCMVRNGNIRSSEIGHAADCSYSCICPSWLKVSLKAFYFMNIYCTYFQVQQQKVTLLSLQGGLNQLRKFGFGIEYADLENNSLLCPQVIQFIDDETDGRRSNNVIVIIKSKLDLKYPIKGKKKKANARVVNAMKKEKVPLKQIYVQLLNHLWYVLSL